MARGIERLAVKQAVHETVTARVDFDACHCEAFDLVHVQAFVEPVHQQRFRRVSLRARFAYLERRHVRG